ncbi:unnamed protein product [Rhizophagus irregularis]|nr:unnamed protein product [Rhizophagus irregularis]CAB4438340.1 unnamed protein product [Rhizophagus irregularis]
MENQSSFKVYTAIEITNPVDVGKLIGHKGCNLKPIATRTVRFSDDYNHQHVPVVPPRTPPRNQRDFDSKERRNNFNQETSYATNSRQPRNRYYD